MRAIILAAGVGSRLLEAAAGRPKVLLELGGKTLLERHLDNLRALGIADVAIVAGFRHELIEAAARASGGARVVRNERFREGSALSVWAAVAAGEIAEAEAPLLVMDGDVLYGPEMLRRLVDSKHETCLLLDRKCELDEVDPVLVPVRGGRPFDFKKGYRGPYDTIGESIGFFRIGRADIVRWIEATRARTVPGREKETLEDIVRELVLEGRFGHEDVTGLPWVEIDFPEDIARAKDVILPALEAGRRR